MVGENPGQRHFDGKLNLLAQLQVKFLVPKLGEVAAVVEGG